MPAILRGMCNVASTRWHGLKHPELTIIELSIDSAVIRIVERQADLVVLLFERVGEAVRCARNHRVSGVALPRLFAHPRSLEGVMGSGSGASCQVSSSPLW